jgi:hypothetical protein
MTNYLKRAYRSKILKAWLLKKCNIMPLPCIKALRQCEKNKVITNRVILNIQRELEQNSAGYRNVPGTQLVNDRTKGSNIYATSTWRRDKASYGRFVEVYE